MFSTRQNRDRNECDSEQEGIDQNAPARLRSPHEQAEYKNATSYSGKGKKCIRSFLELSQSVVNPSHCQLGSGGVAQLR